jgi:ABC-2 type transport system ATP-binding protein
VPEEKRKSMIGDLLALVDLSAKRDNFVEELSRGMKQRLCLARTLVHEPELLILDEPASGLDPHARIELRELLKELRALGKTILVSSHILTELAEMCTHVAIIERGRLLVSGEVSRILAAMQPARDIYVRVLDRAWQAAAIAQSYPGVLSANVLPPGYRRGQPSPNGSPTLPVPQPEPSGFIPPPPPGYAPAAPQPGPGTVHIRVNGDDALLSAILSRIVAEGVPVFGFEETVGDLEEIFLATTKGLVQ